jgi:hypothetical protein
VPAGGKEVVEDVFYLLKDSASRSGGTDGAGICGGSGRGICVRFIVDS